MKRAVIDASVVVKLFFEEEHSDAAEKCVRQAKELLAPDLIWAEITNVIWKRQRRGDISKEDAAEMAGQVLAMPVREHPTAALVVEALDLAMRLDRSVYDGLYLALAVKTGSVMLTADKRLVNALADTPLAKHVAWIGSIR
ncbi:MAG: type II toxin-antitoxin system VapC family toxin [Phycisphaerae bacterium]|jgi:predicted nucleic acid-binding protein